MSMPLSMGLSISLLDDLSVYADPVTSGLTTPARIEYDTTAVMVALAGRRKQEY